MLYSLGRAANRNQQDYSGEVAEISLKSLRQSVQCQKDAGINT